MNRAKFTVALAIVATLATSVALAGEIYRYVDEDGNVHYVDRPTGVESEQRLAIQSRPTDNDAVMARAQQRYARNEPEEDMGSENGSVSDEPVQEEEMTRSERIAAARERQQKCQQYRDRLETFVTARRLYREGEDGERVYLEDNEIQEARDKVQARVEEFCD